MRGWLATAVSRWAVALLLANLVVVLVAGRLALDAPERLAVAGGLGSAEGAARDLIITATPASGTKVVVERQATAVIEASILADPAVSGVSSRELARRSGTEISVTLAPGSALARQRAAERIPREIDPGPLEIRARGEALAQASARERTEQDLPGLALLAAPLVLLVLGLAFGIRHAPAPLLAAASGALGAIALMRVLPASLDLSVAGIAAAAAVGIAVGVESSLALFRAAGEGSGDARSRLGSALDRAAPRILAASLGAAAASATLLAVPLPAARSAAIGGVAAALLAGLSALFVGAATVSLSAPRASLRRSDGSGRSALDRLRGRRLEAFVDWIAVRPGLAWPPALAGLVSLAFLGAQAFALDAVALAGSPATAALGDRAGELIGSRLGLVAGLLTIVALVSALATHRTAVGTIANGLAGALPALGACGLLVLAGDGVLPDGGLVDAAPHASVLIAVLGGVGAVSVARAARASRAAALAGTLTCVVLFGALAGADLDAVAQLGVAICAGLALDLILVGLVVAPSLERALGAGAPSLLRIGPPRLPARFRRR